VLSLERRVPQLNTEVQGMSERRTARRYDLSLPVIIRIPVENDSSASNGKTRDISTRGVYFTIDREMSAGTELDMTLTLPAEVTRGSEVLIRATGKVIRVERKSEDVSLRVGVAAVIERYEIVRNEPQSS
jgi:PilZ domain